MSGNEWGKTGYEMEQAVKEGWASAAALRELVSAIIEIEEGHTTPKAERLNAALRIAGNLTGLALLRAIPVASTPPPIDMVLHCPACGMQHIDAPEYNGTHIDLYPSSTGEDDPALSWPNTPHRSHLCHGCGHIWRPADVPTNGVQATATKGKADSTPPPESAGLTDAAITSAFDAIQRMPAAMFVSDRESFLQGVRYAERFHGLAANRQKV